MNRDGEGIGGDDPRGVERLLDREARGELAGATGALAALMRAVPPPVGLDQQQLGRVRRRLGWVRPRRTWRRGRLAFMATLLGLGSAGAVFAAHLAGWPLPVELHAPWHRSAPAHRGRRGHPTLTPEVQSPAAPPAAEIGSEDNVQPGTEEPPSSAPVTGTAVGATLPAPFPSATRPSGTGASIASAPPPPAAPTSIPSTAPSRGAHVALPGGSPARPSGATHAANRLAMAGPARQAPRPSSRPDDPLAAFSAPLAPPPSATPSSATPPPAVIPERTSVADPLWPEPPVAPPAAAPPRTRAALAEESALLAEALGHLRRERDGAAAIAVLDRYSLRYPQGLLRAEADRARVDALFLTGARDEARRRLDAMALETRGRDLELLVVRGELRAPRDCVAAERDFSRALAATAPASLVERALHGRALCRATRGDQDGAARDRAEYARRFPLGRFAPGAASEKTSPGL